MQCLKCGKSPAIHGITLIRQNEKGVKGIWACEACNELEVPKDVASIVAIIQRTNIEDKDLN